MQFHEHTKFRNSLNALWKKGGPFQKAANEVHGLLGRIPAGDDGDADPFEGMTLTKWGETRIPHCVKYDLVGHARLVTVQTDGRCVLLFCGSHDDTEAWIEGHRGLVVVVGKDNRPVITFQGDGVVVEDGRDTPGRYAKELYERLPEAEFDALTDGIPRKIVRAIEAFTGAARDGEFWEVCAEIEEPEQRQAVVDVLRMLKEDRVVEAVARVRLLRGEMVELSERAAAELPELVDSEVLRRVDPRSPQYGEALKRFMRTARYREWMSFLHPDQQAIVDEDFGGPSKLIGVSGSGKTCVVVRRAIRLAQKYRGEPILVLTLNPALARLIEELIVVCASEEVVPQIKVRTLFAQCREILREQRPGDDRLLDQYTWKTNEHVDEVWQEYYRCEVNNTDARVLAPVHDMLLARGWNPDRYLREELDWIRSALRPSEISGYLSSERKGRSVSLLPAQREAVLEGLRGWEDKMKVVGLVDQLGIAQRTVELLGGLRPRYRCVLVDEVQDFGNVELEIVRALAAPAENDLFLCGDAAQAVSTKHQSFKSAGIEIAGVRSRRLQLNYRNSFDVLQAAYAVLLDNLTEGLTDREDFEVLDPEYSTLSGGTPLLLSAESIEEEIASALEFTRTYSTDNPDAKVCLAFCGYSLYELKAYGKRLRHHVLDGTTSIDEGAVFIADLEQTKGFEFDMVIILNCSRGVVPDVAAPEDETHRDLARLYVAMTRARRDLVLSYHKAPSAFVRESNEKFLRATWREYVPGAAALGTEAPVRLDSLSSASGAAGWRALTGEQFLHTLDARGVTTELSAKLRALVDGRGLKKGHEPLRFRNMGDAVDALRQRPTTAKLWGPGVSRQLEELGRSLSAKVK